MMAPTTARPVLLAMAPMREQQGANQLGETDENAGRLRIDGGPSIARELGFVGTDVGDLGAAPPRTRGSCTAGAPSRSSAVTPRAAASAGTWSSARQDQFSGCGRFQAAGEGRILTRC
jgi:hypothetical protein